MSLWTWCPARPGSPRWTDAAGIGRCPEAVFCTAISSPLFWPVQHPSHVRTADGKGAGWSTWMTSWSMGTPSMQPWGDTVTGSTEDIGAWSEASPRQVLLHEKGAGVSGAQS